MEERAKRQEDPTGQGVIVGQDVLTDIVVQSSQRGRFHGSRCVDNKDLPIIMLRISSKFCTVRLNHLLYDNKKQHNLVVLHGLLGSHKNFRGLMKSPAISSLVNVYMLDNRNHGSSPHTQQHSYPLMATDLKQFIQDHKLKNVVLMGHSMGGGVLYKFSAMYPEMCKVVNQLVIIDLPFRANYNKQRNQDIIDGMNQIDLSQSKEKVMKDIQRIGKQKTISDFLKTSLGVNEDSQTLFWVPNIPVLQRDYKNIPTLILSGPTQWRGPVDILYGQRSDVCNRESCQELIEVYPDFTMDNIHKINQAGHWLHFDNPTKFLSTIHQIISKVTN